MVRTDRLQYSPGASVPHLQSQYKRGVLKLQGVRLSLAPTVYILDLPWGTLVTSAHTLGVIRGYVVGSGAQREEPACVRARSQKLNAGFCGKSFDEGIGLDGGGVVERYPWDDTRHWIKKWLLASGLELSAFGCARKFELSRNVFSQSS